jgi:general secretion pathway protein G
MKTDKRRIGTRVRAFTLLEVLMVVVIIGLLAAFVVPNLWDVEGKQKIKLAQSAVDTGLSGTLDLYRASMGRYPTSEEGLLALYQQPDDEEEAKKWVQVIKKPADLKDVWGHDYLYSCPGQYNEKSFDLSSPGPDGQEGTEDDICNWKRT